VNARLAAAVLWCLGLALTGIAQAGDAPTMEVWKSASCGCCKAWLRQMEAAGFKVKVTDMADVTPIKLQLKVPPELSSCHTARVGGYIVEGHVPAEDILKLLKTAPKIAGIYVPGMPVGSPGMEGPGGIGYSVLALDAAGKTTVFATHKP